MNDDIDPVQQGLHPLGDEGIKIKLVQVKFIGSDLRFRGLPAAITYKVFQVAHFPGYCQDVILFMLAKYFNGLITNTFTSPGDYNVHASFDFMELKLYKINIGFK